MLLLSVSALLALALLFMEPGPAPWFQAQALGAGYSSCDEAFREHLRAQRAASSADRMNFLVTLVKAENPECAGQGWDPLVDGRGVGSAGADATCFDDTQISSDVASIGGQSNIPVNAAARHTGSAVMKIEQASQVSPAVTVLTFF